MFKPVPIGKKKYFRNLYENEPNKYLTFIIESTLTPTFDHMNSFLFDISSLLQLAIAVV